jgi:hypothetical protein
MKFHFDAIKASNQTGRAIKNLAKETFTKRRPVFLLNKESQGLREYARFFEIQRTALNQDEMNFERKLWQDLACLLAGEVLKNSNYEELRQLHNVQKTWLNGAEELFQKIIRGDQNELLSLREKSKVWLATLSQLEKTSDR